MVKHGMVAVGAVTLAAAPAAAQEPPEPAEGAAPVEFPYGAPPEGELRIPPELREEPVRSAGNGYCYVGAHPVNTESAPGTAWHEATGEHTHFYPPVDLRLFARQGRCYHFIGDPADFGHQGPLFMYHGAHPVAPTHGGGWCFRIGGHGHAWGPWSPHFRVTSGVYWWPGPYDDYFAAYWPYYAYFYRDLYPRYYGDGAWRRGKGGHVAAPIGRVPSPPPAPGLPPIPGSPAAPEPAPGRGNAAPYRGGAVSFGPSPPAPGVAAPPPAPGLPPAAHGGPRGQAGAFRGDMKQGSGAVRGGAGPGGAVQGGAATGGGAVRAPYGGAPPAAGGIVPAAGSGGPNSRRR